MIKFLQIHSPPPHCPNLAVPIHILQLTLSFSQDEPMQLTKPDRSDLCVKLCGPWLDFHHCKELHQHGKSQMRSRFSSSISQNHGNIN